ncbi:hypothetical protein [Kibdelosporangium aridum]|uniref:hypothetical protein n=1 Tax=Kibdelosporangium aridum TaxID=2030 RepID=UPI0005258541
MIRMLLAVVALAASALLAFSPSAAADNCDIFINPEDCQNTGWTVGVVATLASGVAVAIAATRKTHHAEPPPPPPTSPTPTPPPPPPPIGKQQRRDEDTIEGIDVRGELVPPAVEARPQGETGNTVSIRLEVNIDPGTQSAQEVNRGPR